MCALLAASYPLPPPARPAFLEHCAREIANLPKLGDGVLHRTIVRVQKMYFAAAIRARSAKTGCRSIRYIRSIEPGGIKPSLWA
jgi:hypothetical protein